MPLFILDTSAPRLRHRGTRPLQRGPQAEDPYRNAGSPHSGDAVGDAPWAAALPPASGDLRIVQAFVNTADPATKTDGALGRLVRIVAEARIDGSWARLKVCANPACARSFYDASRNRTRTKCSLRCSSLIKSRTYRSRHGRS